MDAAVPVDAKNARPPGTWKTAENAVSHSAHTHYCFRERMIENRESTSVAKPSTESDQAQRARSRRSSRRGSPHRVTSPRTKLKRGRISARRPPGICPRPSGRPGFCTTPRLTSPLARTTWATTFWNSITAPSPRLKREDSGSRALREGHGVSTVLSSFQPPRRSCSAKDGTSAAPSAAWMGHGGSSKWRTSTPCRICFLSPSLRGLRTSHPAGAADLPRHLHRLKRTITCR